MTSPSENHLFPTFGANPREPLAATKDQSATLAPGCTGLFFYWVYYSVAVQFEKKAIGGNRWTLCYTRRGQNYRKKNSTRVNRDSQKDSRSVTVCRIVPVFVFVAVVLRRHIRSTQLLFSSSPPCRAALRQTALSLSHTFPFTPSIPLPSILSFRHCVSWFVEKPCAC